MFAQMKESVNEMVAKYGQENPPPPAQVFTIKHSPGDGNIQLVQKVFRGAFEVCLIAATCGTTYKLTDVSLIFCFLLDLLRNR
jgi:mannosyl-oligosaccharide glucosidase